MDFSKTDASLLASGSDDGTVKIYSTKQNRSVLTVETVANVCSVQYRPTNFHYIAVGCSDHNAYVYVVCPFYSLSLSLIRSEKCKRPEDCR